MLCVWLEWCCCAFFPGWSLAVVVLFVRLEWGCCALCQAGVGAVVLCVRLEWGCCALRHAEVGLQFLLIRVNESTNYIICLSNLASPRKYSFHHLRV